MEKKCISMKMFVNTFSLVYNHKDIYSWLTTNFGSSLLTSPTVSDLFFNTMMPSNSEMFSLIVCRTIILDLLPVRNHRVKNGLTILH